MKKTVCDRCGKEIDCSITDYGYPAYMDGPWSIYNIRLNEDVDLCQDCQLELHKFMSGEETKPIVKVGMVRMF